VRCIGLNQGKSFSFFSLVDKILLVIEVPVIVVCGVLLISLLLYAAFIRYFLSSFGLSVPYEDELSRLFFTWLSLLGASYLLRTGDHPDVSLFKDRVIRRGIIGKAYMLIVYSLVIVFLGVILYATLDSLPLYYNYYSTVLRIPMVYYYYAAVIAFICMIIRYTMKIVRFIRGG
jgi:TRAP-type C4-dicarboxylate transport system permease small subunit